jgi:uncharacterized protein
VTEWVYWLLAISLVLCGLFSLAIVAAYAYFRARYLDQIVRVFEEKPLFIIPRGKPSPGAEDVTFETANGLKLRGCYLRGRIPRKGVILFGLEFGSNRWSSLQYCEMLLDHGFDVFAYEPRNQGDSQTDPTYAPMQWVTEHDLQDMRAALKYLKSRKDASQEGIGIFGISKGGSLGLAIAAEDPSVHCVVTDGAYGTYTTVVPYMRRWVSIYVRGTPTWLRAITPDWFYGQIGLSAIRKSGRSRGVVFPRLERSVSTLRIPVLMIHGNGDTYIKPEMAQNLYEYIPHGQKSFWPVAGAKHNQAVHVAGDEYIRRVVAFFETHLVEADPTPISTPAHTDRASRVRA